MRLFGAFLLCLALATGGPARADEYPSRIITLVVPLAAGSGTDAVARLVAASLADELGQKIVVENKTGANGAIGASSVARATPDGYTLLIGGTTTHAANSSLFKSVPYNPVTDFTPLGQLGVYPYALVVSGESPYRSLADLLAAARAKPGTLSFSYAAALSQLSGELLRRRANLDVVSVPYRVSTQAVTDIIGGRVTMMFSDLPPSIGQINAGTLRPLAVTTAERTSLLPDVPTLKEAGLTAPRVEAWTGLFAPAGTPRPIVEKISKAIDAVIAKPELQAKLAAIGCEAKPMGPDDFGRHVASEVKLWQEITKEAGIEPQ